jgi:O-antigen ligase
VTLPVFAAAWLSKQWQFRLSLLDAIIAAFLASNLLSALLVSPARGASIKASVLLAGYAAMYFVVRQILANRIDWVPRANRWILGVGAAQAAYTLAALVVYAFEYDIGGLQIGHLTPGSVATKGTFWEANLLGAYLTVIALFAAGTYVFRRERDTLSLAVLLLAAVALPLTVTRAAGLAFALGLMVLTAMVYVRRADVPDWRARAARVVLALAAAGVLTVTAMDDLVSHLSGYPNLLIERWVPLSSVAAPIASSRDTPRADRAPAEQNRPPEVAPGRITELSQSSVDGRMQAWTVALARWRDEPILGHGPLAGAAITKEGWWYSSVIQALYDTGLVGLIALLGLYGLSIVAPLRAGLRPRVGPLRSDLVALGLGNAVLCFTSQFSSALFVGLPWVFLGVTMATVKASEDYRAEVPADQE